MFAEDTVNSPCQSTHLLNIGNWQSFYLVLTHLAQGSLHLLNFIFHYYLV